MSNSTANSANTTRKVLIIEDEGEMCLLLNILLDGKDNMELDHVKDLKHAKEYLAADTPSVIILDNKLPDGFGVDFLGFLRANYPQVRVIMISGYGSAARDLAMENGADVFMEKPFSRDQLYASIEKLMN